MILHLQVGQLLAETEIVTEYCIKYVSKINKSIPTIYEKTVWFEKINCIIIKSIGKHCDHTALITYLILVYLLDCYILKRFEKKVGLLEFGGHFSIIYDTELS